MKGLIYRPGCAAVPIEVRDFKHIQELCGGYIERVVLDWGKHGANRWVQLWCNEDGIGQGLPPNLWAEGPSYAGSPIFGVAVILACQRVKVGTEDEDQEELGLTDKEIERWMWLRRSGRVVVP